jgi:succinyl-diaminopimelate desuccinylase
MGDSLNDYLQENRERFESDLFEWLRMPSIGTDSAYDQQTRAAASWLADKFKNLGLETSQIETCGQPLVYAQSPPIPGAPTVLVYGHYDVQPPDPLDLWTNPPFEPTVRDGKVYARGATDDKGQMITHLFGLEAYLKTQGDLPVQVKYLIEGEEESGGAGLDAFLKGEYDADIGMPVTEKLDADIVVISDCSQYAPGQPAITYGLKGIIYFDLKVYGPNRDLHSGSFGGTVTNPANAICEMLSKIKDADGRVQIPGFYDDVIPLDEKERDQFASLNFSDDEFKQELGVDELFGEKDFTTLERRWGRPTFDVNGLWSGYQGEGAKTVLPAESGAKFSFRLVPDQDPDKIHKALEKMFGEVCPPGIRFELINHHGAPGFVLPLGSPYMAAASKAIEQGFGTAPVFVRSGGSIPVVNQFKSLLGIDTLLLGWGQDDDNPHSPDEKFSLEDFHKGIHSSACLWNEIAKVQK